MSVFTPPTDNVVPPIYVGPGGAQGFDLPDHYADVDPAMIKLFRHYAQRPRGRNVFALSDGTFTETQPANWDPSNPSAPYVQGYNPFTFTTDSTSMNPYVTKVYWGGSDNPLTAAEVTALTAAGYGAYIH